MSKQATKALIDANITANGTQAITGPILNNVLNTMVDDYGTQEELSQLAQKIDEFAQGKFYGYFGDAGELPAGDIPGFAYVGTEPPFSIYNYDGETWTDSGLTVNGIPLGNGEDIDFNADGLLQFADRAHDAENPNGMGYVILRKNKTFAEQVTLANTIYEIRYDFDLGGASVTIPAGCVLFFNGGTLLNGILNLNKTHLLSDVKINCLISGSVQNATIKLGWFSVNNGNITSILDNVIRVANSTGASIEIPSGEYVIDNLVLNGVSLNLVGVGDVHIKRDSHLVMEIDNGGDIYLNNLHFDGESIRAAGVDFENCKSVRIENCEFLNFGIPGYSIGYRSSIDAIYLKDNISVLVNNTLIDGCERCGVANIRSETYRLANCIIRNCGWYASIHDGQDTLNVVIKKTEYVNNIVENCFSGGLHNEATWLNNPTQAQIDAGYPHNCELLVMGNIIKDCGSDSWGTSGGSAITAGNFTKSFIKNNYISNWQLSTKPAISFSRPKFAVVEDNTIEGNRGLAYSVPANAPTIEFLVIKGNQFKTSYVGLSFYSLAQNAANLLLVEGNYFQLSGGKGISLDLVDVGVFQNNLFKSSDLSAIAFYYERGSGVVIRNNEVLTELTQDFFLPAAYRGLNFVGNIFKTSNRQSVRFDVGGENKLVFFGTPTGFDIKVGDVIRRENYLSCDRYCFVAANSANQTPATFIAKYAPNEYSANPTLPLTNAERGFAYYNTTLKKMILWNGTEWVNMDGTALS